MQSVNEFGLVVSGITSVFVSTAIIISSYIPQVQAASVNIVKNGSFEADSLINPFDRTRTNPFITAWYNSVANEISYSTSLSNYPQDGIRSVRIAAHFIDGPGGQNDPITDFTYISQNLNTTVGQKYELSYYLANGAENTFTEFRTYVGGKLIDDKVNIPFQGFTKYTHNFVATADITELKFSGKQTNDVFYIDNVNVKPVPEPLTLGGTAVAGLLGLWLKKKQLASE